jgi:hypothetical protein
MYGTDANPVLEGRKTMELLFQKIEDILNENFEVISKMLVPKVEENV